MYRVKGSGRNAWMFFEQNMNTDVMERMEIEHDLRVGFERNQFLVYFQPQWQADGVTLDGWEALMRWDHPEKGFIPPDKFIPVAEDTGLIIPLGEMVLRAACRTARQWENAGMGQQRISVNLSARQFRLKNLATLIRGILAEASLDAHRLEVEITESVVMEDAEAAGETLKQLKHLGVRVAIDDFGTGYSSLAYLKAFPIDRLKIDRSFIRDVTHDANDAAIVSLIMSLARSLELETIAEGVETEEQKDFLTARGCSALQGYLLGRPMSGTDAFAFLRRMKTATRAT